MKPEYSRITTLPISHSAASFSSLTECCTNSWVLIHCQLEQSFFLFNRKNQPGFPTTLCLKSLWPVGGGQLLPVNKEWPPSSAAIFHVDTTDEALEQQQAHPVRHQNQTKQDFRPTSLRFPASPSELLWSRLICLHHHPYRYIPSCAGCGWKLDPCRPSFLSFSFFFQESYRMRARTTYTRIALGNYYAYQLSQALQLSREMGLPCRLEWSSSHQIPCPAHLCIFKEQILTLCEEWTEHWCSLSRGNKKPSVTTAACKKQRSCVTLFEGAWWTKLRRPPPIIHGLLIPALYELTHQRTDWPKCNCNIMITFGAWLRCCIKTEMVTTAHWPTLRDVLFLHNDLPQLCGPIFYVSTHKHCLTRCSVLLLLRSLETWAHRQQQTIKSYRLLLTIWLAKRRIDIWNTLSQ